MILSALVAGCGVAVDPPAAPRLVATSVDDGAAAPTDALTARFSAAVDPSSADNLVLVRGSPPPALTAALAHGPPPPDRHGAVVPVRIRVDGMRVELTPRRALAPESRYTLVIGPRVVVGRERLGRLIERAFVSGRAEDGAPTLELVAPLDGATGVVRNLRAVEARLALPVHEGDVTLQADGAVVPARLASDGSLVRLELDAGLDAERRYELRAAPSLRDAAGRPVFGEPPGFTTGSDERTAPPELAGLWVESADRCLVVRFSTDEETRAELCVAERCAEGGPARTHQTGMLVGDLGLPLSYRLRVWDESTQPPATVAARLAPPAPLMLSITEVLATPRGPRLAQQFVELYNPGAAPVSLDGLSLHWASGADALPPGVLPSGHLAVVVPRSFSVDDGVDPPPAPDALLVRIDQGRLGGDGLRASGERLWIEDAEGRMVSAWGPPELPTAVGQSVVRRSPTACDLPSSYVPEPTGRSTPGTL
jgi:hypothetical protein